MPSNKEKKQHFDNRAPKGITFVFEAFTVPIIKPPSISEN